MPPTPCAEAGARTPGVTAGGQEVGSVSGTGGCWELGASSGSVTANGG